MHFYRVSLCFEPNQAKIFKRKLRFFSTSLGKLECVVLIMFFCPQNLAGKTKDILTNLKSLAEETEDGTGAKITMDTIKSRNFSVAMQNFLFNLASAENLVKG